CHPHGSCCFSFSPQSIISVLWNLVYGRNHERKERTTFKSCRYIISKIPSGRGRNSSLCPVRFLFTVLSFLPRSGTALIHERSLVRVPITELRALYNSVESPSWTKILIGAGPRRRKSEIRNALGFVHQSHFPNSLNPDISNNRVCDKSGENRLEGC